RRSARRSTRRTTSCWCSSTARARPSWRARRRRSPPTTWCWSRPGPATTSSTPGTSRCAWSPCTPRPSTPRAPSTRPRPRPTRPRRPGTDRQGGAAMRVLLIGPPGAGKGTQATRIADHFDLGRIATGDLLREHVANGTELGTVAKEYMDRGDLVPDDIVIEMTRERMLEASEEGGYVLDGHPRTLAQAEASYRWTLSRGIPFDLTLIFEIEEEELFARLAGRATEQHRCADTEDADRHRVHEYRAT